MYEILTPILAGLLAFLMAYIIYRRDELFALVVELDKKRCARLAERSHKCEVCICQESRDKCEFSLLAAAITGYYPLIKNQSGNFVKERKMNMNRCCQMCYYSGTFLPKEKLASCSCPLIEEDTIHKLEKGRRHKVQYVRRETWDSPCNCEKHIPVLSESRGDFTLHEEVRFSTTVKCHVCGEELDVKDIGFERISIIECGNCNQKIAIKGKEL